MSRTSCIEEAFIVAILNDCTIINRVVDILYPDDFCENKFKFIFAEILVLVKSNQAIDIENIQSQLSKTQYFENIGGRKYISELLNKATSSTNVMVQADMIKNLSLKRKFAIYADNIKALSCDPSTDFISLFEAANFKLNDILMTKTADEPTPNEFVTQEFKALMNNYESDIISSGFEDLDRLLMGWRKGNLIVIASRPSIGKTAFALNLISNAISLDKKVAFFSIEMSKKDIFDRLISLRSNISLDKLRNKEFTCEEYDALCKHGDILAESGLYIRDNNVRSLFDIKTKSMHIQRKNGLDMIIIDNLQLMTNTDKALNREQEISQISISLKFLAKELNVPIIVLSQLNRSAETRQDKRPILPDLRDSGSIEEHADIVLILHRSECHGIEYDYMGNSTLGLCELIVAKNRQGRKGQVELRFIPNLIKFIDYIELQSFNSNFHS